MPCDISFFAKKTFLSRRGHLQRVSSMIRAEQIATYIGAKVNPEHGYENDVCIYVKPHVKPGNDFKFEGRPYLDICDAPDLYVLARMHTEVPVIVASQWNYDLLSRILPNKIISIPEQHCNFERVVRSRSEVATVGIIGTSGAFKYLPEGLRSSLAAMGIDLIEFSAFFTRQDVVDFYLKIDVQIVWRPYCDYKRNILMNPLKLVNAASFGIPTIAYDEPAFKEMNGCYIPVRTLDEFMNNIESLKSSPSLYAEYSKECVRKSEEYRIENIVELYRNLCMI